MRAAAVSIAVKALFAARQKSPPSADIANRAPGGRIWVGLLFTPLLTI
jgi:hypothetical protein